MSLYNCKKMVFNKKAISPVVATALLLVVAVVAVVGFQSWFTTYQSGVNAKVEQESQSSATFTVERLEGGANSVVYVKNNAAAGTSETIKIKIPDGTGTNCTDDSATMVISGKSVNSTTLTGCDTSSLDGTAIDVVVVAPTGVFTSTQIVR